MPLAYIKHHKNKYLLIGIVLFLCIGGYTLKEIIREQNAKKLNLLIISIDTLRPDHMGVYGYKQNTTPNIDALAKNAVAFTNIRTVVPMTYPSFAAFMTGKDPLKTRINRNRGMLVSNNQSTMATILGQNGFVTGAFTSGSVAPDTNLGQGFDEDDYLFYKGYHFIDKKEYYYQTSNKEYENYVDQATEWLKSNKQKRFFLWVHLMDPHAPYQPPKEFQCVFNKKYCDYIAQNTPQQLETERAQGQMCQKTPIAQEKIDLMKTLYDGGIGYSDQLAGKILDVLKHEGLEKNTLVIIYGDHGEGFDHNYYFNHRSVVYDSAVKIPLIIRYPYVKNERAKSDVMLDNTDILPTILDLLGISHSSLPLDGKSFQSEVTNDSLSEFMSMFTKRNVVYSMDSSWSKYSVFDGRYKFIYSLPKSCLLNTWQEELYDIANDPNEENNLIGVNREVTSRLKTLLLDHLADYNLPPLMQSPRNATASAMLSQDQEATPSVARDVIEELRSLPY